MKTYKKDFRFSYAIGVSPTLELAQTFPEKIQRIMINKNSIGKNKGVFQIQEICRKKNIRWEKVDNITEAENCYALAIFNKYKSTLSPGNHLVLINPSDKGNLGTIIRTMVAFNVFDLAIIKPGIDIFDPKVIRASMGSIFKINFQYFDSFTQYQAKFNNSFYPFMTNGKYLLPEVKYQTPFSLIFGNEGQGLGQEFLNIGQSIKIPQNNQVDSLNLAIAVGIGLCSTINPNS